jgi:hypothetical protein
LDFLQGAAPAPAPIRQVASMAVYNNADNPCFSGRSLVAMADGGQFSLFIKWRLRPFVVDEDLDLFFRASHNFLPKS